MKAVSKVTLILSIVNVCLGTAMLVMAAITAFKYGKRRIEKL